MHTGIVSEEQEESFKNLSLKNCSPGAIMLLILEKICIQGIEQLWEIDVLNFRA